MKDLDGILESSLYTKDLEKAREFYEEILNLRVVAYDSERHVFFRCGRGMLLIFHPEATAKPGQNVPSHGSKGPGHLAFSVSAEELDKWRDHFIRHGKEIEADISWPGGGRSIYIRDPANNSIELASPLIWDIE
jgi:catechol 2,3-dioxygenase-like lactoylglutathione lyase family enzyme